MKKKLKIIATLSLVSLSLTSCNTEEIGNRIQEVVNNMLPNLWVTLMQLAIFIFIALLFIFLAYKPLKKKMQKRADYIENNIKESESKKLEAQEKVNQAQQIIADSEKQAGELIKAAQKTAENKAQQFEKDLALTLIKILKQKEKKCFKKHTKKLLIAQLLLQKKF